MTLLQHNPAALPQKPAPRLHFIDGLRGAAMLMVLLYHCWLFGGQWSWTVGAGGVRLDVAQALSLGHVGVNLFLVLSGFCLFWPFTKAGRPEPTLAEFAGRRCRRILPPYYAVLALCGGAALGQALWGRDPAAAHYALNWIWIHALMAQNLRPGYVLSINGSLWSLALEFQLYLLFPALVEAFRRFGSRRVVWTTLALCSGFRWALVQGGLVPSDSLGYVLAYSVFGRAFEFALGMAAARLVARRQAGGKAGRLHFGDFAVSGLVIAAALADSRHGHFQALTDAMWGLLFAGLLLGAAEGGTALHRALSWGGLVRLGTFSYSVYLIHLPLVMLLGGWAGAHCGGAGLAAVMLCGALPLMLLLGYGFHCVFERPFMTAASSRKPAPSRGA